MKNRKFLCYQKLEYTYLISVSVLIMVPLFEDRYIVNVYSWVSSVAFFFQAFYMLLKRGQQAVVTEWVVLSLESFVQQ